MNFLANRKRLLAVAAALCIVLSPLVWLGWYLQTPAGDNRNVQLVAVAPGTPVKRIAGELADRGILTHPQLFVLCARMRGKSGRLKAGTYRFDAGMSPAQILRHLVRGDIYTERFAVPEGYSTFQIADLLAARKLCGRKEFLAACRDRKTLDEFGIKGKSCEGYLFPSTYQIVPGTPAGKMVRMMIEQFDRTFSQRFSDRIDRSGMSREQVVTLASVIEKEAVLPEERPLIASVFLNRLRLGMPLQSDPTAVYGVRAFAGAVSKRDIMRHTPYNTYLIRGLPPGPIGNPSAAAIESVLNPARTSHLYFVAKGNGTHYFSDTLAEHNRAVARYLKSAAPLRTTGRAVAEVKNDRPYLTGRR